MIGRGTCTHAQPVLALVGQRPHHIRGRRQRVVVRRGLEDAGLAAQVGQAPEAGGAFTPACEHEGGRHEDKGAAHEDESCAHEDEGP